MTIGLLMQVAINPKPDPVPSPDGDRDPNPDPLSLICLLMKVSTKYTHTYIHAYMHTCMHACMHACMHTLICLLVQVTTKSAAEEGEARTVHRAAIVLLEALGALALEGAAATRRCSNGGVVSGGAIGGTGGGSTGGNEPHIAAADRSVTLSLDDRVGNAEDGTNGESDGKSPDTLSLGALRSALLQTTSPDNGASLFLAAAAAGATKYPERGCLLNPGLPMLCLTPVSSSLLLVFKGQRSSPCAQGSCGRYSRSTSWGALKSGRGRTTTRRRCTWR